MSGQLPTTPGFVTVGLSSVHRTLVYRAHSGRRSVRRIGAHRWRFTARYPALTRDAFMPVYAFILSQGGRFGSFQVIPPDLAIPRGVATGLPLVNGAGQAGNALVTDGWTPNTVGIVKAGDVLKCGGHTKVYMVTADVDADGLGGVTIPIEPPLVQPPADNEPLVVTGVPFTMALANDVQQYRAGAPSLYTFELDLEEVL
ncbi:MAG: hypothetical protein ACE5FN_12005 [Leptospirillia bacterium]